MKKIPILLLSLISLGPLSYAQIELPYTPQALSEQPEWMQLMYQDDADIGQVLDAYEQYYQSHPFVKNGHTQYLKRWLRETETYHYQFHEPGLSEAQLQERRLAEANYLRAREEEVERNGPANWTCIGPTDWDHDAADRSYAPGAAHVYTVEHCAGTPSTLYAGTATAGIWKSTNGGGSWVSVSQDLTLNRVYAIEVHPTDPNIAYASLFDNIYKTTDGGQNWNPTGDAAFQAMSFSTKDMRANPGNGNDIWAATDDGLWHTTNGGSTWTGVLSGSFQEIEFHPTNSSIIYVVKQTGDLTEFYKSIDGGGTFNQQTNGWPAPASGENKRAEIAVTPANPSKVYALLTGAVNGGSGLFGVYVSTDEGASWTFSCCGPQPGGEADLSTTPPNINMMGWSDVGSDNGGQYYYDLGLAVSPVDENKVFVGGVNLWVSNDGGATFTCPAKWSHPHKANYVHADIHDIHFYPNGNLWLAGDGGIFLSTDSGASFDRQLNGIAGSDFWGFDVGFSNDEVMLGGAYHNGTLLKNGNVYLNGWICTDGGDGTGGFVNFAKADQVYSNYNIKTVSDDRTVQMATRGYDNELFTHYTQGRSSQLEFDPRSYNIQYYGRSDGFWRTEDDHITSELMHNFGEQVADVEIAWSNPQVIYITTWPGYWDTKKVYKTTNGGQTWTDITPSTSIFSSKRFIEYDIEVDPEDPNRIWLARVGRNTDDSNKIFRSTNGGTSWTNLTTSTLNGEVLTNIVHQYGTNQGIYIGTTRTVYYRNGGQSDWQLFATGLPASSRSRKLVINYQNEKIYNGTNRSVWVSDLFEGFSPMAQMSVDKLQSGCARDTFHFFDRSIVGGNGSRTWSFPGASYVSSTTAKTPQVVYGAAGTYSVTLQVGSDTKTWTNVISVGDGCSPQTEAGLSLQCNTNADHVQIDNVNTTISSLTISAWIKPNGIQDSYTGIVFNDDPSAGLNFRNNNELGYHWPSGSIHWAWGSGLFVPVDEWSYVAMVVTPTSITFYLNEEEVTRTINLGSINLSTLRIGSYRDWSSRNFNGAIDEVCVWTRALSRDEIRELRHLTKERQADPDHPNFDEDLLGYYQFNEDDGADPAYDRVRSYHGTLLGSAGRIFSTAPVGTGTSSRQLVSSGGEYVFSSEGLSFTLPGLGLFPGGELVVSRLAVSPDQQPSDMIDPNRYWIVNNYGFNTSFSMLENIQLRPQLGVNAADEGQPQVFKLYKRASNADGDTWGEAIDQADAVDHQGFSGGEITFSTGNGITSFSQLVIGKDLSLLPVDFLAMWLVPIDDKAVEVHWQTALEMESKHFVVERSTDGRHFEAIGQVASNNALNGATYSFLDTEPIIGLNYYRIKAVDFDLSSQFSPVRSVRFSGEVELARLFPNPIKSGSTLYLEIAEEQAGTIQIFLTNGQLWKEVEVWGNTSIPLTDLPAGVYPYRIITNEGQIQGKLVVD